MSGEIMNEQAKAQIKLWEKGPENSLEIEKQQVIADISIDKSIRQAKALADVNSAKELQRMDILFSPNGDVVLTKQCFGEPLKGELPFKLVSSKKFLHEIEDSESVLMVLVQKKNGVQGKIWWNTKKTEPRYIRSVFDQTGISFGFGEKKEAEIRRKFLVAALNVAETVVLTERHGWNFKDDEWKYILPEELTWKEVRENVE